LNKYGSIIGFLGLVDKKGKRISLYDPFKGKFPPYVVGEIIDFYRLSNTWHKDVASFLERSSAFEVASRKRKLTVC